MLSPEHRKAELMECMGYFLNVWNERVNAPPKSDLISLLAHGPSTRDMDRMEYLGNLLLLIVGGNDTTRNTITGSVLALNQNPEQYDRLKADRRLIPGMVSETIRWQTPLAHMRRNATRDVELGGKTIRKGEKVVMWYVSGNRDERVIERPNDYWIESAERAPPPVLRLRHSSLRRQPAGGAAAQGDLGRNPEALQHVEVLGEPERVMSSFVRGYASLPVRLHA